MNCLFFYMCFLLDSFYFFFLFDHIISLCGRVSNSLNLLFHITFLFFLFNLFLSVVKILLSFIVVLLRLLFSGHGLCYFLRLLLSFLHLLVIKMLNCFFLSWKCSFISSILFLMVGGGRTTFTALFRVFLLRVLNLLFLFDN